MSTTLMHLDPTALTVGTNVRHDTQLEPDFLASIKERGVLEPVLAHHKDGLIVVDQGQRRTLAAAQQGLTTIPVLVSDEPPAETDRVIDQLAENDHRTPLTGSERVQAVQQLALLGLSVSAIAKKTATPKAQVVAATAVAKSQAALKRLDTLTLEDAAVLAEFDGDDKAIAQLEQEARWGRSLAAPAERIRQDRAEQAEVAAVAAAVAESGLRVVDPPDYDDTKTLALERLRDGKRKIDPDIHAGACPGHVVWVKPGRVWSNDDPKPPVITPGCTGWSSHGHVDSHGTKVPTADLTPAQQEKARKERRHVIDSNKDWKAATTVRRRWLTGFLQRKTAPDGAEALIALAVTGGWNTGISIWGGGTEVYKLLGTTKEALINEPAVPRRALQIALAVTVACWEHSTTDDTWRTTGAQHSVDAHILRAISQWGHELSDIECRIVDGTAASAA